MANKTTPTERGKLAAEVIRKLHKRHEKEYVDEKGNPLEIPSIKFYLDSFYNETLVIAKEVGEQRMP